MPTGSDRVVIADPGTFVAHEDHRRSGNVLGWPDYERSLSTAQGQAEADESVVAGSARIGGIDVELALFSFDFMGGSMGEVAGDRLIEAIERAMQRSVPFVLRIATGGARMQEGMRSLVQMPRLVAARLDLGDAGCPYVVVFGHPTTGGVLASIGALADLTIAESGATVGFAGPRLVESFTGRPLAGDSHTADSALRSGLVDAVAPAGEVASVIASFLTASRDTAAENSSAPSNATPALVDAANAIESVRARDHPSAVDLVLAACDVAVELRGDRAGTDDAAVRAVVCRIGGRAVVALALDRARAPGPAGFRKARRCLSVAERLRLPVVTLVDTRGADPSEESEASGLAWEIAALFEAMLNLRSPSVCVVTGEGGSGGALAFATTDRLVMWNDATFSVIAPESAAEILWRDPARAPDAARLLKLTASDLLDLGIADDIAGGPLTSGELARVLTYHLDRIQQTTAPPDELPRARRRRWMNP